jgi:peptidoglycan hydrolase-like protein with peptidoglycan-binding domain
MALAQSALCRKGEAIMVKAGLIITLCFIFTSGCAFIDMAPPEVESSHIANSTVQQEPQVSVIEADTPSATVAPIASPRSLRADEIRRMQVRLRDVGLDPGPIDGVAGAKTAAAAKRFESGCAELQALLDGVQGAAARLPNRQETLTLQHQLRSAGFNPGPLDGIFGAKMKSVSSHLQNGCPVAREFALLSGLIVENAVKSEQPSPSVERPNASRTIAAQSRQEADKQIAAPVAMRPQEDIRILQLRLRDAGYDPGPFDGVMGPKTKLALQQMQQDQRGGKVKTTITARAGTQY